jgi:hypothetical protein
MFEEDHDRLRGRIRLDHVSVMNLGQPYKDEPWMGQGLHRDIDEDHFVLPPYCSVSPRRLGHGVKLFSYHVKTMTYLMLVHSPECEYLAGQSCSADLPIPKDELGFPGSGDVELHGS